MKEPCRKRKRRSSSVPGSRLRNTTAHGNTKVVRRSVLNTKRRSDAPSTGRVFFTAGTSSRVSDKDSRSAITSHGTMDYSTGSGAFGSKTPTNFEPKGLQPVNLGDGTPAAAHKKSSKNKPCAGQAADASPTEQPNAKATSKRASSTAGLTENSNIERLIFTLCSTLD